MARGTDTAAFPAREVAVRVASSAVLAPVALAAVWLGGIWLPALLAAALVGLTVEWRRLVRPPGGDAGLLAVLAAAFAAALAGELAWASGVLVLGAAAVAVVARRRDAPVWPAAFGPLYLGLPALAILWLRAEPETGPALTAGLLIVVWASDAGAWATGRALGGARLAPRISPNKTWAGAVGGAAAAGAAGAALEGAAGTGVGLPVAALTGLALSAAAQTGDLFESWLKRRRGVKDSGQLIPGHGGLLDRVDGVLGAAPAAAVLAALGGVR